MTESLQQAGRELPEDRSNGPAGRANHNDRSIDGADPARFGELLGYKSPIAPLQALDVGEMRGKRTKLRARVEQLGNGFGGHDG